MSANRLRQLIFILIINIFFINLTVSTSFKLLDGWERVSDTNEEYNAGDGWTTYSIKSLSIAKIEILQEGDFCFASKMDKLTPNKLYFNNKLIESTSQFKKSNYFHVNKNDVLKWVFSVTDSDGGKVWISFPAEQIPPGENKQPSLISLTPDKSSPQEAGNIINWIAKSSDEDNDSLLYKFLLNDSDRTKWIKENTWKWNTTEYLGTCIISVQIRDKNHAGPDGFDDNLSASFSVTPKNKPPRLIRLTSDKLSPQEAGCIIIWTANAIDEGNRSLLYKFRLNGSDRTTWIKENTWIWNATDDIGTSKIEVQIKDENYSDPDGFEDNIETSFLIRGHWLNISSLVIQSDKVSPQAEGSTITFNALPLGLNLHNSLYRFVLRGYAVTDWSNSPNWKWKTDNSDIGTSQIEVQVKDKNNVNESRYNYSANLSYDIGILVSEDEDLQESINLAQVNNISAIFIKGLHKLDNALIIDDSLIKLIGISKDARLVPANSNLECAIYLNGNNCSIINITINDFLESIILQADNCTIENTSVSSLETAIDAQESDNTTLINNIFHGNSFNYGEEGVLLFINNSSFIKIINNTLDNSPYPISLEGVTDSHLDGNNITYHNIGVEMIGCSGADISNNSIFHDQNYENSGYSFRICKNCEYISIINNIIEGRTCDDNSRNTNRWEMNCWKDSTCSDRAEMPIQSCRPSGRGSLDQNPKCCNGD